MSLQCGIVGLPNVGKSTLFNALSNAGAEAANYPFCTIDPNVGIVKVPDPRLQRLEALVQPAKLTPAIVQIVDIAGLVKGAAQGEGLGNKFLANIRECNAILHVLRCFEEPNVTHVEGSIDPLRDRDVIELELQLKDLETLEKRRENLLKKTKGGDKAMKAAAEALEPVIAHVDAGENVRSFTAREGVVGDLLAELQLLTDKPVLYICNVDEATLAEGGNAHTERMKEVAAAEGAQMMMICAAAEAQIAAMDDPEERAEFLAMLGIDEPGLDKLIRQAYDLLGLRTYFTAGKKEVRAWTIHAGMTAPQAAAVIHTDFEKHFIRAEVIKFEDYDELASEQAVKEAGKMSVEGKEYIVQDGDVVYFRTSA